MKKNVILSLVLVAILMVPFLPSNVSGYSDIIGPSEAGHTVLTWTVVEAPEAPVSWLNQSFAVLANWSAQSGDTIVFEPTERGPSDSYLEGVLIIGEIDFIMTANNSLVAYNLVLAISNFASPWEPGLVIPTGTANIEAENISAYSASERVYGNYLNGTIESKYENLNVGGRVYECIVWDYVQDPSGFGEPQRTNLAYDLATGVLVRANTSLNFGTPYNLVLELDSIQPPVTFDPTGQILFVGGLTAAVVVFGVLFIILRKRS